MESLYDDSEPMCLDGCLKVEIELDVDEPLPSLTTSNPKANVGDEYLPESDFKTDACNNTTRTENQSSDITHNTLCEDVKVKVEDLDLLREYSSMHCNGVASYEGVKVENIQNVCEPDVIKSEPLPTTISCIIPSIVSFENKVKILLEKHSQANCDVDSQHSVMVECSPDMEQIYSTNAIMKNTVEIENGSCKIERDMKHEYSTDIDKQQSCGTASLIKVKSDFLSDSTFCKQEPGCAKNDYSSNGVDDVLQQSPRSVTPEEDNNNKDIDVENCDHKIQNSPEHPIQHHQVTKDKSRKSSSSTESVEGHVNTHIDLNAFKCSLCQRSFSRKVWFQRHIQSCKCYVELDCKMCGKTFTKKELLQKHKANHRGEKNECVTCGKVYTQRSHLYRHMKTHKGKQQAQTTHKCSVCEKAFHRKDIMWNHMKTHSYSIKELDKNQHECKICGKHIGKKELSQHIRTRHTKERAFPCLICKKTFYSSATLKRHNMIHTGEKPFVCTTCGKGFIQKVDLCKHELCHSGERHFKCPLCSKLFSRKYVLLTHIRRHDKGKEKPYPCNVCGKHYSAKRSLKFHATIHEKDKTIKS